MPVSIPVLLERLLENLVKYVVLSRIVQLVKYLRQICPNTAACLILKYCLTVYGEKMDSCCFVSMKMAYLLTTA